MMPKKSRTLRKWFLSYCIILALCIATSAAISLYARVVSYRQTRQIYGGLMSQVQIDVDSCVREAFRLFDRIALNTNIVASVEGRSVKNPYLDYLVAGDLGSYLAENDMIQDVFLVNHNSGKVMFPNGHLDLPTFFSLYYAGWELDYDSFLTRLSQANNRDQVILRNSRGEILILLTNTLAFQNGGGKPLTACVALHSSRLLQRLNNIRWDEDISILIQNRQGDIVSSVGPHAVDSGTPLLSGPDVQFEEVVLDGRRNEVFAQKSAIVPWQYLSVTPASVMGRSADGIGLVAALCLIGCATIGALLSFRFSRRNYKPLREVVNVFSRELPAGSQDETFQDEYAWLKKAADAYIAELESSHSLVEHSHRHIRNHLLFRLMETPFDLRRDAKEMQQVRLEFKESYFQVLNFYFNESQALLLSTDVEKGRGALSFAIINIFTEMIGPRFHVELTDMGNRIGVIVNLPENSAAYIEQVREAVFQCQENIEKHLGAIVQCAIGTVYNGIEGIYLSSTEAKEAGEHLTSSEASRTILYEEIRNRRTSYHYPMEMEQQLVGAISAGNKETAAAYLRQVVQQNAHVKGELRKCITLDIIGSIIKGANQTGVPDALSRLDLIALTSGSGSNEELLVSIVEDICDMVRAAQPSVSQHESLVRSVKAYVEANYSNPDVNVSFVGEHFNLTPTYLSGLFKEQAGVGLLDYVNYTRIERSKERLLRRENVNDVAIAVGYRNSGAFIRVFKRFEGITPGQWSSVHCQMNVAVRET